MQGKLNCSNIVNIENCVINHSESASIGFIKKDLKSRKESLGWNKKTLDTIKKESEKELKLQIAGGKYYVAESFVITSDIVKHLISKAVNKHNQGNPSWSHYLTPKEVLSLMVYAINISGTPSVCFFSDCVELPLPSRGFYSRHFNSWGNALALVGLTKNKTSPKKYEGSKEQLLDLKIKSKQYVISTTPQRTYWKDDLLLKLKNSVDPTLKTTIANGKYSIYSDFIITSVEAERLSTLTYIASHRWLDVMSPKDFLSLLAYSIHISENCGVSYYRDGVPLKIPSFKFFYKHFGSWPDTLSLLGLTEN